MKKEKLGIVEEEEEEEWMNEWMNEWSKDCK